MVNIIMLIRTGVLAVLLLAGAPAFASCSSGVNDAGSATITLPGKLPVNATVGTILYDSGWVTISPTTQLSGCSSSQRGTAALATPGTLVSGNAVYATAIPGIGIATWFGAGVNNGGSVTGTYIVPASNGGTITTSGACTNYCGPMGQFRTRLVVTGPISAGTMSYSGVYATSYWSDSKVGSLTINGTTSVVVPTCTVQTPSIAVSLPTVSTRAFPSVGAAAGRSAFSIGLQCTGQTSVGIIMSDANNTANTSKNLTLQSGGASGAALQVLWDNKPITFGQASPFVSGATPVTNPALVTLGNSPTGHWSLPFVAQYVRTGDMTPGAVVARATFVMNYK